MITKFDSPRLVISLDAASSLSDLGMSARRVVLTMTSITGNIWMLENVHR